MTVTMEIWCLFVVTTLLLRKELKLIVLVPNDPLYKMKYSDESEWEDIDFLDKKYVTVSLFVLGVWNDRSIGESVSCTEA